MRTDEVGTDVVADPEATGDGRTSTDLDPAGEEAEGEIRSGAGRDESEGNDPEDDDCPERRTAWLRLLRAVLLTIVAVARLIRAL